MTGMSVTTTPMFTNACRQSQAVDAGRQEPAERVRRRQGDPEPAIGQQDEEPDHGERAEEAELLADDREDVVVVSVGQDDPTGRGALAQPGAEEPAEPEGQQALHGLVARGETIGERISERLEPLELVVLEEDRRAADRRRDQAGQVDRVGPGEEEHEQGGEAEDAGRADVGRLEDQQDEGRHDHDERPEARPQAGHGAAATSHPVGEVDHEGELGELARLDGRQPRELEPLRRAANRHLERVDLDQDAGARPRPAPRAARSGAASGSRGASPPA